MGTVESLRVPSARKFPATTCQERQESAEPLWFALLCRDLWGTNAPKDLEATLKRNGMERSDRTCRAWAAGDSPPPVNILLVLQRDEKCGQRVLDYVMRGCEASHWREHERALRIVAQIDRLDLE